ncbi:unnamed protein product, partial [Rotaria socialis]
FQNEVNDRICKQQVSAKISTHGLSFISGNLVYDARQPEEIGLVPLGEGPKIVSARDFCNDLCEKTFNIFLCDQNHRFISLPPLTDGEP